MNLAEALQPLPSIQDEDGHVRLHAYVVERLKRLGSAQMKEVENATGISWRTQQKIRSGEIVDPGVGGIEKLANFFMDLERAREGRAPD